MLASSHNQLLTATKMNGMEPGRERVLDKMTVFQKCVSSFNQPGIASDRARVLLTDLVHLFYRGETFGEADATQLFFTITRLFQKESAGLKQMVYLAIKELAPLTDNVIMGTSVLMRDVQTSRQSALCKAPALRALCAILDSSAVESMDRLMRSAIVDKDEAVACAALTSAYHLLPIAKETVRRWSNEVMESARASNAQIAQYHSLGLLYEMRTQDSVALLRLVLAFAEVLRDPSAMTLHVRIIGKVLKENGDNNKQLRQIMLQYLRNRTDAPVIEAAKTVLSYSQDPELINAAVDALSVYLSSPRAIARFAAVRAIHKYASTHTALIASKCNSTLEALISDSNFSIATFAITALLKTGSPSSVDALIQRISQNITEIPDDFRFVVVDAVRSLAQKFPAKHARMLEFFAENLRHESGKDLKFAIVAAIRDVLESGSVDSSDPKNTAKLDSALLMLAESIEDSEYPQVTVRVLHLLGSVGPLSSQPETLVRYIYNRVILENSVVRAAAVSALSRFQKVVPEVKTLLARSKLDPNDEVRDRAAISLVFEIPVKKQKLDLSAFEEQLVSYLDSDTLKPFDITEVPLATAKPKSAVSEFADVDEPVSPAKGKQTVEFAESNTDWLAQIVEAVPQVAELGKLLHTGPEKKLTDDDMEYIVSARTHVFESHLLLQYNITNNFDLDLENVELELDLSQFEEGSIAQSFATKLSELKAYTDSTLYVALERDGLAFGPVPSTLKFVVEGGEDEYRLGEFEILPAVYMQQQSVADFDAKFAELGNEEVGKRQLSGCATLMDAALALQESLGMFPVDDSLVIPADAAVHDMKLYGRAINGAEAAVTVRLVHSTRSGVAEKLTVRSDDPDVAYLIVEGF